MPCKKYLLLRLKIAVGSTPSSLYISKPLHSVVLQILSFHLRISLAFPAFRFRLPPPPSSPTRCFSLHTHSLSLAKPYGSAAVFKNFSGNSCNQILLSEGLKSRGRRARRPEIDRLRSDAKLPPMPWRQTRWIIDVADEIDRNKWSLKDKENGTGGNQFIS